MEIRLKDFPNEIYLQLDNQYKKELFRELKKYTLDFISQRLGISKTTIINWKKRTDYISLRDIKNILDLLKKDLQVLENKIVFYGTQKSKYYIKNPILPIKDSPALREIVTHIMCDGCFGDGGYAAYYNFPKETKEEFITELKKCFGEIDFDLYEDHIHFPTAIPTILKDFFEIEFNSKKCRLPLEFYQGTREKLVAIIRAAIIDEGTVDGSNIRIDSCNKDFLEDLRKICEKLNYQHGEIWESKSNERSIFRFNIYAKSLEMLSKDIKDLPLQTKQKLITIITDNQKRGWKYKLPGEVKKEIIEELIKKPLKTIDLILKIKLQKKVIGNHLKWFIKQEMVNFKVNKNKRIYFIKNKEKAIEFLKSPNKFIRCEKINNYGLSQLKILKMLNKKSLRYSEMEKILNFNKSAFFKLISSLKSKRFIKKINNGNWSITYKGKNILLLDEDKARYLLYANVK